MALRVHGDIPDLLIGIDLGKVCTRIAHVQLGGRRSAGPGDAGWNTTTIASRHHGRPLDEFFALYRSVGADAVRGIVATGVYSQQLRAPVVAGLPEEIAQEWAVRLVAPDGPLSVVRIGGTGYSVLVRSGDSGSTARRTIAARRGRARPWSGSVLGWVPP